MAPTMLSYFSIVWQTEISRTIDTLLEKTCIDYSQQRSDKAKTNSEHFVNTLHVKQQRKS